MSFAVTFDHDRDEVIYVPEVEVPEDDDVWTFEVVKVDKYEGPTWTVIAGKNGKLVGGDHHWLNPELAVFAKAVYQGDPSLHGRPSSEVLPSALLG